ncbi:hypothetical protein [Paenibacillus sp. BAC0078]
MTVDRKQKANQYARKQAKESGASIYYIKNNKRVREDAEGNKVEIVYDGLARDKRMPAMIETRPVMTVFAGINGAGKSNLKLLQK